MLDDLSTDMLRPRVKLLELPRSEILVAAFRQVFSWALEAELDDAIKNNPARDVRYLASNSEGFHSWTIEEVKQFEARHPIGTRARLALALLLYTGQRSDIVRFGRQHVMNGWLRFTQWKNRNRKPVRLEIPIIPELQQIIDASPCGDLTFLVNELGNPFTSNGFGNKMRQWCDEARLPQCSAHGLRKAAAARLAELGCTDAEIMSITGHIRPGRRLTAIRRAFVSGGSPSASFTVSRTPVNRAEGRFCKLG